MKRKILIILLLVSFFNYIGCYSYSTITLEDIQKGHPRSEESIKLILKDEGEVLCPPYSHFRVDKPSDKNLGKDEFYDEKSAGLEGFVEKISSSSIDSFKVVSTNGDKKSIYWLANNTKMVFDANNLLNVTPESGTGYFAGRNIKSSRKIDFEEVKEIQIAKSNAVGSIAIGILIVASVVGLIWLFSSLDFGLFSGDWGNGGGWNWSMH